MLLLGIGRLPATLLHAQTPAQTSEEAPVPQTSGPPAAVQSAQPSKPVPEPEVAPIMADDLRQLLIGKDLFLRGGYLDNNLEFDERGRLISHSPKGSYTLCAIRITKIRLLKHKVELEGERYGLHFLGALPGEDPTAAVDRVNITPKKKLVRITIDRELVVKEKPQKHPKADMRGKKSAPPVARPFPAAAKPAQAPVNPPSEPEAEPTANSEPASDSTAQTAVSPAQAGAAEPNTHAGGAPAAPSGAAPATAPAAPSEATGDAAQAQAEIALAPAAERPADPKSITTTHSQAHANELLEKAIDHVFAVGIDPRMIAAMPAYWKLYYQGPADWPADPSVLRQSAVDKKARLVSVIDPTSNQYAQAHGVAGMAEYRVVVDSDGKPGDIAIARPIGFGLDETAVESLRKATFEPAMKDGHAVSVTLDMVVEFRIYSKLTAEATEPHAVKPEEPILPGPYSVQH